MPELPEVETIVRQLRPEIVGKKVWGVRVLYSKAVWPNEAEINKMVRNLRVVAVERIGKFIIIKLERNLVMVVHLRMTGRMMVDEDEVNWNHLKVEVTFSDAKRMWFCDMRKFGRFWVGEQEKTYKIAGIEKLGRDPYGDCGLDDAYLANKLRKKGQLKRLLLDQTVVAGIGNIYADEICFKMRLHPEMQSLNLKDSQIGRLKEVIYEVLDQGIENNGASISDFVGTRGDSGKQQDYLNVYGRVGDNCYYCDQVILKTKVAGRGTFFCPKCQKK